MSQPAPPLDPPPRKAQLRRGIRNMRRAYRTVFALVILVFGGWAALDAFRWYDLTYQTQIAEGTIVRKHTVPRQNSHEYRIEYSFNTADGTHVPQDTSVPFAIYEKTAEGRGIPVVYLRDNPKLDHWLFDNDLARMNVLYLMIGHGLAALLAIIVLRLVDRPIQRELRLAKVGVVVPGQIVSIGKPRGRMGFVRITYSFTSPTGATVTGACRLPRRFPVETLAPGMAIDIVADPRNARIHKPRLALDFVEFGDTVRKKA